ncbi:MAG: hypothetical protein Tsb0014_18440 [Pleurocapsa sp.]
MQKTNQTWYIIKQENQTCAVVAFQENESPPKTISTWGPFATYQEAIAKRIGLIRVGKCQPQ